MNTYTITYYYTDGIASSAYFKEVVIKETSFREALIELYKVHNISEDKVVNIKQSKI